MKVVLAGDYGTHNLADQGMLAVLRERLIERFETEITVLSRHPSPLYERLYRVRTLADLHDSRPLESRGRWFRGLNRGDSREHLHAIADAIRGADILVLGGGRLFVDHGASFMRGDLAAYTQLVTLAHFLNTPVMLFAMSVVSEASETAREHLRYVAEGADIVTVRELQSRDRLVELGVGRDRVHVLPDPTLGLPYLEREVSYGLRLGSEWLDDASALLRALEFDADRRVIAVNLRSYAWRDGASGQELIEERIAALFDEVVRTSGCQLLFIPQKTFGGIEEEDDRVMAQHVVERMEERSSCRDVAEELSIWQALAILQHASLLISMRRHGLTFGLTQRVPVVSISMDENTEHLMSSLGIGANSISLAPGRLERSLARINNILDQPVDARRNLLAHVEECAVRTRGYVDLIADTLGLGD